MKDNTSSSADAADIISGLIFLAFWKLITKQMQMG